MEVETTTLEEVSAWAAGLEQVHERIAGRFRRAEPRRRALAYLRGLLSPIERKNGWQVAEAAGESTPDGMQRLLASAEWDADRVRDDLQAYVIEHLGDPEAVLVLDETGFLKKGNKSVGVQRQYSGTAGRIENCQIGVFLGYASRSGFAFLDRELYLPRSWAADPARRAEAGVPETVTFQTKGQVARRLLERAEAAGIPHGWVTGDENYGSDGALRGWLEERHRPYVLAVRANEYLWIWDAEIAPQQVPVAAIAARVPEQAWVRLSAGDGAKGPRVYDWALVPRRPGSSSEWQVWLLVRRSLSDPTELAYYFVYAPCDTPLETIVRVAGRRWTIEEGFEQTKGEVGLDQYEVRRWAGWYRHITLALFGHAYLVVTRARAASPGKKGDSVRPKT